MRFTLENNKIERIQKKTLKIVPKRKIEINLSKKLKGLVELGLFC